MTYSQSEDSVKVRLATKRDAEALQRHRKTCGHSNALLPCDKERVLVAALASGGVVASMTVGYVKTPRELKEFFGIRTLDHPHFPIVVTNNVCTRGSKALNALRLEVLRVACQLSAEAHLSVESLSPSLIELVHFGYKIEALDLDTVSFSNELVSARVSRLRFFHSKTWLERSSLPCDSPSMELFAELRSL